VFAGKPSLQALRTSASLLGVEPSELAVVGDDPELEVPMAHMGGAFAVAVHTGIGDSESFNDLPESLRPHLDLPDLGALVDLLSRCP
jgi:4-nitrophenyl phosphatase